MEQPSHWALWMARSLLRRPPTNSGLLGLFVLQQDFVFSPASLYACAMALGVKVRGQHVERDFPSTMWIPGTELKSARACISSTDIWCQDLKIKAHTGQDSAVSVSSLCRSRGITALILRIQTRPSGLHAEVLHQRSTLHSYTFKTFSSTFYK